MATSLITTARDGALAGTAATVLMSLEMLAAQRLGLMGEQPPARIAEAALGHEADEAVSDALAVPLHFAFGAGGGALYAAAIGPLRRRPDALTGVLFGLLVWACSYLGWVPWIGALPPPDEDRLDRQVAMVVAHALYGAALGALLARSEKSRQRRALRRG